MVIVLMLGSFAMTLGLFMVVLYLTITHPILTLNSGEKPKLILDDEGAEYHAFFSHVWSTGQAKRVMLL
jgi:hypothetical protein